MALNMYNIVTNFLFNEDMKIIKPSTVSRKLSYMRVKRQKWGGGTFLFLAPILSHFLLYQQPNSNFEMSTT